MEKCYTVRMSEKRRTTLLGGTTIACGILGFVLLMWTPKTGGGILVYVVLFAVLAITSIILFSRRSRGHDPNKSEKP
jgi:hypothetical protein